MLSALGLRPSFALRQSFFWVRAGLNLCWNNTNSASEAPQKKTYRALQAERVSRFNDYQLKNNQDMKRSAAYVCSTSEARFVVYKPQIVTRTCKDIPAEERMKAPQTNLQQADKYHQTKAQTVQNKWFGNGSFVHSLHSKLKASQNSSPTFPIVYSGLTGVYTQPVHNISTSLSGVITHFSPQLTEPITTTTTFIYKRIEEEAA